MCTGRVDLAHVLRAFSKGQAGVLIGGCHLGDCHYDTGGNYHAVHMVQLCKKLLGTIGVNPDRLRIAQVSAGEGLRFVEIVNEFSQTIKALGPLGVSEGLTPEQLTLKLGALTRLLPTIRLVERERLRVRFDTEEEYEAFFNSSDVERLLRELVEGKVAVSQILWLLGEQPRSTGQLSETLGLNPSEVSRHLGSSAKHGLVRYDDAQECFRLA